MEDNRAHAASDRLPTDNESNGLLRLGLLCALAAAVAAGCRSTGRPGEPYPRLQNPEATPASQLYSS